MSLLHGFKSLPLHTVQLSLAAVLKCGQSFRWSILSEPHQGDECHDSSPLNVEYHLCLRDRVVCLRQSPDFLYYRNVFPDPQPDATQLQLREAETVNWLNDYFQLDVDLGSLYKQWSTRDAVFAQFQNRFEGIRMLRQDPWENLVSFICSSNNNIARITKMVQNLCANYSPALLSMEHPFSHSETLTYHPFPSPSALADPKVALQLRSLGFGYRADYIQRTANMLVSAHGSATSITPYGTIEASELWLKGLRLKNTAEARDELLRFIGVGRKVADCILLMSLDKAEVVPVDTHVYQIAVKHYGMKSPAGKKVTMSPKLYEEINTKFQHIWGQYAGWAHSVLFTADLKSFSHYGLPTPVTPVSTPKRKQELLNDNQEMSSMETPNESPLKRKNDIQSIPPLPVTPGLAEDAEKNYDSLVERVKRRRNI